MNDYYTKPYIRAQPYLIGMMTGYFLWKLRGKELKLHWVCSYSYSIVELKPHKILFIL